MPVGQLSASDERACRGWGDRVGETEVEEQPEMPPALGKVAVAIPELTESADQIQAIFDAAFGVQPGEGIADVGQLGVHVPQPRDLIRPDHLALGLLRQGQVVGRVSLPDDGRFVGGGQASPSKLTHRSQHAEAWLALVGLLPPHEVVVHERADAVDQVERTRLRNRRNRLSCRQREAADKDREVAKEFLFVSAQ